MCIRDSINTLLEEYIGRTTGFLRKVSNSRYIAVVLSLIHIYNSRLTA